MKICVSNICQYNSFTPKRCDKISTEIFKSNNAMSFGTLTCVQKTDIDIKKLQEEVFFEDFMDRKGKVTQEEYENIKKNHPSALIKAKQLVDLFYFGNTTPKETAEISLAVSKYLNERYKNYRIISLGTSPAPIAEQLQYLGHDVVFLPISAMDISDNNSKEMHILIEYLKTKNSDDKKTNILLDYTYSGHTLEAMTKLIKKNYRFKKTVKSVSLNNLFEYLKRNKLAHPSNYSTDMYMSHIENISNVPHFPVTKSGIRKYQSINKAGTVYRCNLSDEDVFKKFESYSTPLARAFSLCTMAEIDKLVK